MIYLLFNKNWCFNLTFVTILIRHSSGIAAVSTDIRIPLRKLDKSVSWYTLDQLDTLHLNIIKFKNTLFMRRVMRFCVFYLKKSTLEGLTKKANWQPFRDTLNEDRHYFTENTFSINDLNDKITNKIIFASQKAYLINQRKFTKPFYHRTKLPSRPFGKKLIPTLIANNTNYQINHDKSVLLNIIKSLKCIFFKFKILNNLIFTLNSTILN
ncbi:hypothetical protein BpHYR1_013399 [Brachionus plicatilis]|uniref:RNA-directed DNA polymerase from mobile element jockey-like n=1 Tax=Brachionus plicatilis TaxID=10195 RepID=A0A3M7RHG1_BRAPC|nr:hypothetical protein BpHYR1_013399 [Brachionus plicatilis]